MVGIPTSQASSFGFSVPTSQGSSFFPAAPTSQASSFLFGIPTSTPFAPQDIAFGNSSFAFSVPPFQNSSFSFTVPTSQASSFIFTVSAFCGDSVLSPGERCDDGNTLSGDGCSALCTLESTVVAGINICGDGITLPPEQCDDGNTIAHDGCSASCTFESSFVPIQNTFIPLRVQDAQGTVQTIQVPLQQLAQQLPLKDPRQKFLPIAQIPTQVAGVFTEYAQTSPTEFVPFQYQDEKGELQTIQFPTQIVTAELTALENHLPSTFIPFQQVPQFFPTTATLQALPATLAAPRPQGAPIGDTGPAALVVIIAGAAAGMGFKRKKKSS
ncbi:hypothetical protein COU76_05385 [Candidatus Peregrinibacteria bacterium CG10_big_fil_rev_8_21_14_0_10_49_10]|nr:MAG: hypothetical protein COU76_05385 [Candidatus Peregrinibacteria bacterium CG10_big_fil_rev_8_21_14_0_10_49_10]